MEFHDLLKILEGDIGHIDSVDVTDIALHEMRVTVKPSHVRNILINYLASNISAEDLTRWASFICMRSEYGSTNYLNDELADYYEDMFYVIQRLSTPEIDGEINEVNVKSYLAELDKYFNDSL